MELGEEPASRISLQVSDGPSNGQSHISKEKFSQTSNNPILQQLPHFTVMPLHPRNECYSSRSPAPSRDSDGLPQALSIPFM